MRPRELTVALLAAAGCAGAGAGGAIRVGGMYRTTVSVIESSCADMGVQQNTTAIGHQPGDTVLTVTHAGATYQGVLARDGSFRTVPSNFSINNVGYTVVLTGRFTRDSVDIRADVDSHRQPPCRLSARWYGPKEGPANALP